MILNLSSRRKRGKNMVNMVDLMDGYDRMMGSAEKEVKSHKRRRTNTPRKTKREKTAELGKELKEVLKSAMPDVSKISSLKTSFEAAAKGTKVFVKLTELNGWEHEEWIRFYPCEEGSISDWGALALRLDRYNKEISKARWSELKEADKADRQNNPSFLYSTLGLPRPVPSVTNTTLSEFHIDATRVYTEKDIQDLKDAPGLTDDGDDSFVVAERRAFDNGDQEKHKQYFYHIGRDSSYMEKHLVIDKTPSVTTLQRLANANSDEIGNALYKSEEL